MDIGVLWDRLAGELREYVENWCLSRSQSRIKPSYEIDYEINCLEELKKHTTLDDYWVHRISACENINDLPIYLQELVLQYLPRFFKNHPEYKNLDCLKINTLDFLDIGLPLEAGTFETTSKEIKSFRKYCELIGKKPEQLTQEELQKYYEIEKTVKKVKYIGESDSVSLIHGKIYICLGEEHGEYRIIDEEGYDTDEDIQGYLYPKRFFVEVNDE